MADCLTLELDDDRLELELVNGIAAVVLDTGWPEVRDSVIALPDRDGVADYSRFMAQRVVTISGEIIPNEQNGRQSILDRLARYCVPGVRPRLVVALAGDQPRAIVLRADAFSAPLEHLSTGRISFAASWRSANDPRFYALDSSSEIVLPPLAVAAGRVYDLVFPRVYPTAYGGAGTVDVHVAGTAETWPTFEIFGPITNPNIAELDADGEIAFVGLNIAQGHYVTVESATRRVYADGDPAADRYSYLDVARTRWFALEPGDTTLRFTGTAYGPPTQCRISWTDAYL